MFCLIHIKKVLFYVFQTRILDTHWIFEVSVNSLHLQGDSNMTGTDLCVNKPHCIPVIFEPPCTCFCIGLR
jgi:hypothetical protein